jgi:glucose/arabinose dehydrogenase
VGERNTFAIYRITAAGGKTKVGQVPGVSTTGGEGGLLGLALSPSYSSDKWLYAYHSSSSDNRVVRMKFDNNQLGQPQPVLTGIPRNKYHNGGRIIFGPDGMLYVATGDAQNGANAQNKGSLGGKILRITPDGKPAPGNPFGTAVYSYGHRNVQGLWFDSRKRLWASEFGDASRDEVNLIEAGKNYGWPECEGRCGKSGFVDPAHEWPVAQASPSGLAIVKDVAFMASLRGTRLWRMRINGNDVTEVTAYLIGEYGRLRTIVVAPDGSLWVTTSNHDANGTPRSGDDKILRIQLDP